MKKKILGLDIGIGSCGWALIEQQDSGKKTIKDAGSVILPYAGDAVNKFQRGIAQTLNQERTEKRSMRRQTDRFRRRKKSLITQLHEYGIIEHPDCLFAFIREQKTNPWELRAKAVTEKISLPELGRVLFHLNKKRGYKQQRGINCNEEKAQQKKEGEYIQQINTNTQEVKNKTIGQYFHEAWKQWEASNRQGPRPLYKNRIFQRSLHIEEFQKIMKQQQTHYEDILTNEVIDDLQRLIFSQRPLKSQKHLVSICPFESKEIESKGKTLVVGPKVAPISSPIAEITRLWESINNIRIYPKNEPNAKKTLSDKERQKVFEVLNTGLYDGKKYLDKNNNLSNKKLLELLFGKEKHNNNSNLEKRTLSGNKVHLQILSCLSSLPEKDKARILDMEDIRKFIIDFPKEEASLVDSHTSEIIHSIPKQELSDKIFFIQNKGPEKRSSLPKETPSYSVYYRLWHVLYSVVESPKDGEVRDTLCKTLANAPFFLPEEVADRLMDEVHIPKGEFAGRSHKCMRKILPYLMQGYLWNEAAELAGYNHSKYRTKEENENRTLKSKLQMLPMGSLRQPMVEKILNSVVQLVNAIIDRYGAFEEQDEIHIELARELKKSNNEKKQLYKLNKKNEVANEKATKFLQEQGSVAISRKNILKYRLFTGDEENHVQPICLYCGQPINFESIWDNEQVDVDHIIPQSLLFDDSKSNKVLAHRGCNHEKGNRTAFDFMRTKGEETLRNYCNKVIELEKGGKISKTKYYRLLASYEDYCNHKAENTVTKEESLLWENFINRQLRETQYISKKAKEMMDGICKNIVVSEGGVTAYLRHQWGWNNVLMDLQVERYKETNHPTEIKEINGHQVNIIPNWTKRDDQRHHAIDALVVACTTGTMVQQLNTLHAQETQRAMEEAIGKNRDSKKSKLDNYVFLQQPFTMEEVKKATANILIKYKVNKKAYTLSKQPEGGSTHITPRGPLHEETLYGIRKILIERDVKDLFDCMEDIVSPKIKALIQQRLEEHGDNKGSAKKSLKKNPIYLDDKKQKELKNAHCHVRIVTKRIEIGADVGKFLSKKIEIGKPEVEVDKIFDKKIRQILQERMKTSGNDAFKNLEENPIWLNKEKGIPIKHIRVVENTQVVPIGKDSRHVKMGNNHHLALYRDQKGDLQESVVSRMHAVDRTRHGFPMFITRPNEVWEEIINRGGEELPQEFLTQLPKEDWTFEQVFPIGDMCVIGMSADYLKECIEQGNQKEISKHLYRVQKLSSKDYMFRHHLETKVDEGKTGQNIKHIRTSLSAWETLNPIKVRIDTLGHITMYD